jgi:hypothetical protein
MIPFDYYTYGKVKHENAQKNMEENQEEPHINKVFKTSFKLNPLPLYFFFTRIHSWSLAPPNGSTFWTCIYLTKFQTQK